MKNIKTIKRAYRVNYPNGTSKVIGGKKAGQFASLDLRKVKKQLNRDSRRYNSQALIKQIRWDRIFKVFCFSMWIVSALGLYCNLQPEYTKSKPVEEKKVVLGPEQPRDLVPREVKNRVEEVVVPLTPKELAQKINIEYFGEQHWNSLDALIGHRESGWKINASNPSSGACGMFQRYVRGKGCPFTKEQLADPEFQIRDGLDYIKNRYGNPTEALRFWENESWKVNPNPKCRKNIAKCKWY